MHANIAMKSLCKWFCENILALNASKTKYIIITSTTNAIPHYKLRHAYFERIGYHSYEKSTKYIRYLIWKNHLTYVNTNIFRALSFVLNGQKMLPIASTSLY